MGRQSEQISSCRMISMNSLQRTGGEKRAVGNYSAKRIKKEAFDLKI